MAISQIRHFNITPAAVSTKPQDMQWTNQHRRQTLLPFSRDSAFTSLCHIQLSSLSTIGPFVIVRDVIIIIIIITSYIRHAFFKD